MNAPAGLLHRKQSEQLGEQFRNGYGARVVRVGWRARVVKRDEFPGAQEFGKAQVGGNTDFGEEDGKKVEKVGIGAAGSVDQFLCPSRPARR